MVDVELDLDDYETLEKWYGLLFGEGKIKPKGQDLMLYNKLSQMHIGFMRAGIRDAKKKMEGQDDG